MQHQFVKSSIREAIVGSVFKIVNLSDGFSIHQNATKYILEGNWVIFSHYKLSNSNVFKFHTRKF